MASKSSQLDLYEPESASTLLSEKVTRSHRFKIEDYSLNLDIGVGKFIESDVFTVGGYECVIRYYPDRMTKRESYGGRNFTLDLEPMGKVVKARVRFNVLYQDGRPSKWDQTWIGTFGNNSYNCPFTITETDLVNSLDHFRNDSFTIMCTVTVVKRFCVESDKQKPLVVLPSDLDQHLSYLLESGKGSDVVFEVRGETFNAHKCILAARSAVFSAQFFGPMNENGEKGMKINDIEPDVFRALLHFIYSDSVPELEGDVDYGEKQNDIAMYQHLLVAADRYEVERLKIMCEIKLSQSIEVNNFATTLTLAEQHNCAQLKASCLEFVSCTEVLVDVMKTDGFEHLTRSCPFILKELVENARNDK